jgi:hypothetical protein
MASGKDGGTPGKCTNNQKMPSEPEKMKISFAILVLVV